MDVARLGLAHNTLDEVMERYRRIREVADREGRNVGILIDLPGPKVRLGNFGDHPMHLATGHSISIVPGRDRLRPAMSSAWTTSHLLATCTPATSWRWVTAA